MPGSKSGIQNAVLYAEGEKISATSSRSMSDMQQETTDVGKINYTGDPNGFVPANPGSTCHDPVSGNVYIKQTGTGNTGWVQITTGTSVDLHTARFIVSAGGISDGANYTTIADAITDAVAATGNQTIFLQPGTYAEAFIFLPPGINLSAYNCDSTTPNVTILGQVTLQTNSGVSSISGICLQTDGSYFLAVQDVGDITVYLDGCNFICSDNDGITFTNSGTSFIYFNNCVSDITDSNYRLYDSSATTGLMLWRNCRLLNSSGSIVPSINISGVVAFESCGLNFPVFIGNTGGFALSNSSITSTNFNSIQLDGTSIAEIVNCTLSSGNQSCIDIQAGCTANIYKTLLYTSGSNAITNLGTINYSDLIFNGASLLINGGTQNGGTLQGIVSQVPSSGFLGEEIISYVIPGNAVSVTTNTATDITSINLPIGVWLLTGIIGFDGTLTGTKIACSISDVSSTEGARGNNQVELPIVPILGVDAMISVPGYKYMATSPTTIYLVGLCSYTVGTCIAFGKLSAIRIG